MFSYNNIGEKIKGLAIASFIVEAIGAVITGIILVANEEAYGILIVLFGPIVAWVSSWLLYGFGELISKTCDIEQNTRQIRQTASNTQQNTSNTPRPERKTEPTTATTAISRALSPANTNSTTIDQDKPMPPSVPYYCVKCGHNGPYGDYCPKCGSSIKRHNKAYDEAEAKKEAQRKKDEEFKAAAQKTIGNPIGVKVDFTGCANCPICGHPIDCRDKTKATCRRCGCEVKSL